MHKLAQPELSFRGGIMIRVDIARVRAAFPNASTDAASKALALLDAPSFAGVVTAADAKILMRELDLTLPELMLGLTSLASFYAVVPISNFRVGAVACGLSGNLYYGANMEFTGPPLSFSTHAEQAATVNAWTYGEQGLSSLAVNAAPCGYCRQFLYETTTASKLSVLLSQDSTTLTNLLPLAFGPSDLGVSAALLSPQNHGLALVQPNTSHAVVAALGAANMSYAPYTSSFAGVGIAVSDGNVWSAPYAENAAYNPSMSPMEAALSVLNLRGYDYGQITAIALVQVDGAKVSQVEVSQMIGASIGAPPLTIAWARTTV